MSDKDEQDINAKCVSSRADLLVSPLVIAFVQGAQWWEWYKEKATMWQSDRNIAEKEALQRDKLEMLGKLSDFVKED